MGNKNKDDSDKKSGWAKLLEPETLKQIVAVIGAIAGVITVLGTTVVLVCEKTQLCQPRTPISSVSPAVAETAVPPGPTLTHSPSPTATNTPSPTPTATATATPTPTPTPTATSTPALIPTHAQFEEFDDFTGMILDPSRWHIEGGTTTLLTDGSLFLNVASGDAWVDAVVYVRLDDREARVVAAEVVVLDGTSPGQAGIIAGPIPHDTNGYVNFGILYDGEIYLQQGTVGDPEPQWLGFWPRPVGEPHVLRIEWTGTEVWFEADGERLTALETDGPLGWFGFSAGARRFGYIEDRFNWVGWDWHP